MQRKLTLKEWVNVFIISMVASVGLNLLLTVIDLPRFSPAYQDAVKTLYAPPFVQQLLIVGIVCPVFEELLFRGIAFRLLRKTLSFFWAGMISAIIFGLYHGNLVQFVYAGILGVLLAYFYEKYESIVVPVVSHITMNILVLIITKMNGFIWMLQKY